MAPAVYRRLETRERERDDDDCGSDGSTLKAVPLILNRSSSTDSVHTYVRHVNSAVCIENDDFDSDFQDEFNYEDDDESWKKKTQTTTRIKQIDLSPEALKKRAEVYNKWLESVNARDKERKRLQQEEREKLEEAHREVIEERKMQAEAKVQEWMEKKKIEAEKKMARINEMKKNLEVIKEKPKEFKKAINFQQWINQKNENLITAKKRQEEKKKLSTTYQKCRETISSQSYDKWVRSASSKAKPVPIGKGLDSLRGSSTRIYVNPEPWNDDWD